MGSGQEARRPAQRILLSEGASTSAREAVTALGLQGHHIELCDPDPHCISRFSRFVRRFHRCPGIATDPQAYLDSMVDLLRTGRFDILLPIHEQGLIFAKAQRRLPPVGMALPSFEAYVDVLDKARFSRLLSETGLAQPRTELLPNVGELASHAVPPFVLKRPVATASRGVWLVRDKEDLARAAAEIGEPAEGILVQEMLPGPVEQAQAVFDRGRLVGVHAFRRLVTGLGGGAAEKESVVRPEVRGDLCRIADRLAWHGALSVDYILRNGTAYYIDGNPRLVEPMNALFAGVDLTDLLLAVSRGESPPETPWGRPGVRSHVALQALLGVATRSGTRSAVLREAWRLLSAGGTYRGSREELTPIGLDWLSALPLAYAALALLARPAASEAMARSGWGAGLLTSEAVEAIRAIEG